MNIFWRNFFQGIFLQIFEEYFFSGADIFIPWMGMFSCNIIMEYFLWECFNVIVRGIFFSVRLKYFRQKLLKIQNLRFNRNFLRKIKNEQNSGFLNVSFQTQIINDYVHFCRNKIQGCGNLFHAKSLLFRYREPLLVTIKKSQNFFQ